MTDKKIEDSGISAERDHVSPKKHVVPPKENIVPPKRDVVQAKGGIHKLSIFFSIIAILIAAAAFGFSYLQLTKQNTSLNDQVATMQQQATRDATQLQALAESVQQLQQVQQANLRDNQDVTALYMQLNALDEQIDKLPLSPTPLQPAEEVVPATDANEANLSWWQKGLNKTLYALRQIVIVRYNESKTIPLVLPGERHFLYQNLHAEIQNARWAVLHRNEPVYQTSLNNVTMWVQQYFVQQSPVTTNVLQSLAALRSVNIQPSDQQQTGA